MIDRSVLDDLSAELERALRDSPLDDVRRNLRALLIAFFDRFDLVTREDLDAQQRVLERAQARLAELEARLAELESAQRPGSGGDAR